MPRCPRCSKNFVDMSRVINQPRSSCLSYHEEVLARASAFQVQNRHQTLHQETMALSDDFLDNPMGMTTDSDFPMDANTTGTATSSLAPFLEMYPGAAQTFGRAATFMDIFDTDPHAPKRNQHPYYPFASVVTIQTIENGPLPPNLTLTTPSGNFKILASHA